MVPLKGVKQDLGEMISTLRKKTKGHSSSISTPIFPGAPPYHNSQAIDPLSTHILTHIVHTHMRVLERINLDDVLHLTIQKPSFTPTPLE